MMNLNMNANIMKIIRQEVDFCGEIVVDYKIIPQEEDEETGQVIEENLDQEIAERKAHCYYENEKYNLRRIL